LKSFTPIPKFFIALTHLLYNIYSVPLPPFFFSSFSFSDLALSRDSRVLLPPLSDSCSVSPSLPLFGYTSQISVLMRPEFYRLGSQAGRFNAELYVDSCVILAYLCPHETCVE
jgi:hypothetical protein